MSKPRIVIYQHANGPEVAYNLDQIRTMQCARDHKGRPEPGRGVEVLWLTGHREAFGGRLARLLWESFTHINQEGFGEVHSTSAEDPNAKAPSPPFENLEQAHAEYVEEQRDWVKRTLAGVSQRVLDESKQTLLTPSDVAPTMLGRLLEKLGAELVHVPGKRGLAREWFLIFENGVVPFGELLAAERKGGQIHITMKAPASTRLVFSPQSTQDLRRIAELRAVECGANKPNPQS